MDLQLNNKHVLITGGSKGIGLACAEQFLQEGARVSLVSRQMESLEQARETLLANHPNAGERIALLPADLRDAQAAAVVVEQAEKIAPVDILVNSAGAAKRTPPNDLTPQHWRDAMEAKYFTYINVIDPLVKRMAARQSGVILSIVGMGGKSPKPTHLPGGSANAALMLASAGLAAAYGPQGIRVNAINPGITLTNRLQEGLKAEAKLHQISFEEAHKRACSELPLGRIATPEEIANAAVFLCSSKASYISGAILSMDGAVTPMVV